MLFTVCMALLYLCMHALRRCIVTVARCFHPHTAHAASCLCAKAANQSNHAYSHLCPRLWLSLQDWTHLVQVGRSLRSGSSAQAADLVNLRNSCLEQQTLMGADVSALNQKVAHLETQLRPEQRTQDLLESQAVLIAELRYSSSLSSLFVVISFSSCLMLHKHTLSSCQCMNRHLLCICK